MSRSLSLALAGLFLLFQAPLAHAAETISYDFVADREFPADAERKREFATSLTFENSGLVVAVTGANEKSEAVEVSRRGPGGLGVKGNGDRDADGGGTTSGNRVNNGESLNFVFSDSQGNPQNVALVEVVFSRIVRDLENFADAPPTGFELLADNQVVAHGELNSNGDDVTITLKDLGQQPVAPMFSLTNLKPFHPIANRYRVTGITVQLAD